MRAIRPLGKPLAVLILVTAAALVPSTNVSAAPAATTVTVNLRAGLATVAPTALGVNHAVWDAELGTNAVADLLHSAGVTAMRYPGGSYSDIYHWVDNTAPGGYVAPNTDFDHFMAGVTRAGAQAIVTANYGTGTPQEAADWVRYANVSHNYGVRYWEIGNENYGNGHYGAAWEADNHADKSPAAYANGVVAFAEAMKAVDPTVKIGAVLTTPGNWPDGIVAGGDAGTWNQVVLSIAGSHIDFVTVHWYPGGSSAPESLSKTEQVTDAILLLRKQTALPISLTEINTGYGQNTQPGALFAADMYAGLIENGVFTVDWWNVHNGATAASTIGGQTDYQDFGLLSSATCTSDGTCEPALNTPFAPYYALSMLSAFARPGDQLVRAVSDDGLVSAHAARRPNGDLTVLLVNKDPDNAHAVTLRYPGYTASPAATVLTYTTGATAIASATGPADSVTAPAYSLTTVILHPATPVTATPVAPGQPTVTAITDRDATISWPVAAPGGSPIAKYEVHRQNGTVSDQWGEAPGTSFTVHNLIPGTRYTVNIITRDTAGRVSWASAPLIFQTGTPASAPCAVKFTNVTDWGNGYVASIDVTNTGIWPVTGWTMAFTWPTGWQQLGGGWNGTWTQEARTVRVTNADYNGALAPGTSVNVGFVGNYQGPNVVPATFTVNGNLCTTR
jgi:hypothetical protein